MSLLGTSETEPLRRNVYGVGLLVILASLCATLGLAEAITVKTVLAALGVALGEGAALLAAVERVHDKVWAPHTVQNLLSHETPAWAEIPEPTEPGAGLL